MLECKAIADLDEGDIWILRSKLHPFGVQSLACLAPRCKELDSNQLASILSLLNSIGEHDFCCCQNQVFRARCFPPTHNDTLTLPCMTHAAYAAVSGHQIVAYQLFVLAATMSACLACLLHQNRAVKSFGLNTHSSRILRARRNTWPQHPVGALSHLDAYYDYCQRRD